MKKTLSKIVLFSLTIAILLCCGFPALADVPSPCTQCILQIRPDILPFYEQNGWDISPENQDNIIDNWCGIDPVGCCAAKFNCDTYCELCDPPSPCTQCILQIRPDILPFYEQNGWDISPENQDNIIDNWCGIDPVGCCAAKKSCDGHCGMHNTYNYTGVCPNPAGGRYWSVDEDVWNFFKCECVSYCADKLNENGIPFHNYYLVHWGNADNWMNAAVDAQALRPDKVMVTDTPNVGDIAWFGGHVAHVVHVYPDNYVDVCEYNYNYPGYKFGCRYHKKATSYIRFYKAKYSSLPALPLPPHGLAIPHPPYTDPR